MIGLPTKAKEATSPHEVRLAPLDTNPVFQSLSDKKKEGGGPNYEGLCILLHCSHILSNLKSCSTWYFYPFYVHKLTPMQAKHQLTNGCILYRSPAAFYVRLITVVIALLRTNATQKIFLYYPLLTIQQPAPITQ